MGQEFSDHVAVVTGGGRGIGEATCMRFAEEGADVAVVDWDGENASGTAAAIESDTDRRAIAVETNVGDEEQVAEMAAAVADEFGAVDTLVNVAGIRVDPVPLTDASEDDWDRILDVNLKGMAFCAKHVVPLMDGGGAVVNIASGAALTARPGWAQYDATKGGIISMTRDMACDHADDGVRVNAVSPGWIITEYHIGDREGEDAERYVEQHTTPHEDGPGILERAGHPREIADPVVFLASEKASYVTGENLVVDGGSTIA